MSNRGQGGIYEVELSKNAQVRLQKGDRVWRICVSLGKGGDNKYRQEVITYVGTRKGAEQKKRDRLSELHHGEYVSPTKTTVGAWLDRWLELKKKLTTQNTQRVYDGVIRRHLKPALGAIALQKLTSLQVEQVRTSTKTLRCGRCASTTRC